MENETKMVGRWIKEPVVEKEIQEKPKLNIEFSKRSTTAKTYRGFLKGCLQKARNDENKEMSIFIEELMKKFDAYYPQKIVQKEIEIISGWKGKDVKEIYMGFREDFLIKEHIKDKETGKVSTITYQVAREDVNRLLFWIKQWKIGETHKCYDFAVKLGWNSWKDLWRERKIYFRTYYRPIKVLEALGIIKYSGRGDTTRIR